MPEYLRSYKRSTNYNILPGAWSTEQIFLSLTQSSFDAFAAFSSIGTGSRAASDIDRDGGTMAAAPDCDWPLITPLRERLVVWVLLAVPAVFGGTFSVRSLEFLAKKFCQ